MQKLDSADSERRWSQSRRRVSEDNHQKITNVDQYFREKTQESYRVMDFLESTLYKLHGKHSTSWYHRAEQRQKATREKKDGMSMIE